MPDSAQLLVDTAIGVSATLPSTFDAATAGYPGQTYTAIGQITSWTPGGITYTVTPSNPVNQRSTDKYKGTYNNGADQVVLNRDDDDAGVVILMAALASDNDYAFQVTYQDGSIDYFTGKVVSVVTGAGDANALVTYNITIERTRDTVTVASV